MSLHHQHNLSALSTFALPSNCQTLKEVSLPAQLSQIDFEQPTLILGEGSNTLFIEDYQGQIILPRIKGVDIAESDEYYLINAGAGENWHQLVQYCHQQGIYGLENLSLIPGSCGAAPIQNIGAYGLELSQICQGVQWYKIESRQIEWLSAEQCKFGYRDSIFKHTLKDKGIIVGIKLKLPKIWQPNLSYGPLSQLQGKVSPQQVLSIVESTRRAKLPDPAVLPNAGSFFKNPVISRIQFHALRDNHPGLPHYDTNDGQVKLAAGWLIEQAGLKGQSLGGAGVHEKQALVLVNRDRAVGKDVINLARLIQQSVMAKFNVELEPEVRLIGRHGEQVLSEF